MEFQDRGILIQTRPFGEGDVIAILLTENHGKHAGLVKGGNSRSRRGHLEIGGEFECTWRGRMAEGLGTYSLDSAGPPPSSRFLNDPDRLLALQALCQTLAGSLSEREPASEIFTSVQAWLSQLEGDLWPFTLCGLEVQLLGRLGFGLDLTSCASTGQTDELVYVSPRSGRAVSREAGAPYAERMLALPAFLIGDMSGDLDGQALAGLKLTGHFLAERVFALQNQDLPWARRQLEERLANNAPD